jgi:pimeloyl-ACP methyl ester carboxylesterase
MHVFLIHGMGRSPVSMGLLGHRLRRAGHEPHFFGYSVALTALDSIAERFAQRVRDTVSKAEAGPGTKTEPFAVIGHSLGNVITRLAAVQLPASFARFVMLAPPNQSPAMARWMAENPVFRWMAGDAGQRLADEQFFQGLAVPSVATLIVAGTAGPRDERLPLGDTMNDGVVTLEESRLGAVPLVTVPATHTFLMNRQDVTGEVLDFLA